MRKQFLTFLHSSNALLEFEYDGWNIISVSGQWSYSEYKSVTEGGRIERLDIFDDRVLLPLEKHILLMPLLYLVTVNSTEHDTTNKRKIGSAVARTIC